MKKTLAKLSLGVVLGLSLLATSGVASACGRCHGYYYHTSYTVRDCAGCCKTVHCKTSGYYTKCGNWVTTRHACWYK